VMELHLTKANLGQWTGIFVFTVLLALLLSFMPMFCLIIIVFLIIFLSFYYKLNSGILLSFALFLVFNRFNLHYISAGRDFVEVILVSSFPILIIYSIWLVRRLSKIDDGTCKNYINKLMVLFTIWVALSIFWSKDIIHGLNLSFAMLVNLAIVQLFTVFIKNKEDLHFLLRFLIVLGCILSFVTLTSKWYIYEKRINIQDGLSFTINLGGETSIGSEKIRAGGFAVTDQAAFMLNFFIFLALSFLIWVKERREKVIYAIATYFLITCAMLTNSKGGLGSLIIGLFLALLINPFIKKRKMTWYFIIMSFFIAGFMSNFIILGEVGRVAKSFGSGSEVAIGSLTSRLEIWEIGFRAFYKTFGLGFGTGSSAMVAENLPHMHSFYFSALFDLGFIGLTLFIIIILRIILELYRQISLTESMFLKNLLSCLFGALIAATIQGLTISEYTFSFFWIIIGLIVAITTKGFLLHFEHTKS